MPSTSRASSDTWKSSTRLFATCPRTERGCTSAGATTKVPITRDVEMATILPVLRKAKPAGLLFETANPRHQHDLEAFTDHRDRIPDDKVLIPGVIDTTTNFIEHPHVGANRLRGFVDLVGADRVIAGTDCGFATFAGFGAVDPEIVYAKLATLAEGAELASRRLAAVS